MEKDLIEDEMEEVDEIERIEEEIKTIERDKRRFAEVKGERLDRVIPTLPERRSMIDHLRDERVLITADPIGYSDREIARLEQQKADIEAERKRQAELEKELEDDGEVKR